jgi:hypothetical protein
MNRSIVEIDSQIAKLREELTRTQNDIQSLAEERGKILAKLEHDTTFRKKLSRNRTAADGGGT